MTDFSHDRDPGIVQNQNAFERTCYVPQGIACKTGENQEL